MKKISFIFILTVVFLTLTAKASSAADEVSARFEASDDRELEVRVPGGRVFIKGVDGDEVRARAEKVHANGKRPKPEKQVKSADARAQGLRRVTNTDTGLEIFSQDEYIGIATSQFATEVDVFIEVPRNVDITVNGQFTDSVLVQDIEGDVTVKVDGDVRLENIRGDVEVDTGGGWIYLDRIEGGVVANSKFAGIEAHLDVADSDKPISLFATGHIDIAIGEDLATTLVMKSSFGEIFTDFDLKMQPKKATRGEAPGVFSMSRSTAKGYAYYYYQEAVEKANEREKADDDDEDAREDKERKDNEPSVMVAPKPPRAMIIDPGSDRLIVVPPNAPAVVPYGTARVAELNGGGVEIRMTTMSGNIYIRKLMRNRK